MLMPLYDRYKWTRTEWGRLSEPAAVNRDCLKRIWCSKISSIRDINIYRYECLVWIIWTCKCNWSPPEHTNKFIVNKLLWNAHNSLKKNIYTYIYRFLIKCTCFYYETNSINIQMITESRVHHIQNNWYRYQPQRCYS